ncbi:MAG: hypothetical protein JSV79_05545 [Armatimonadota bacterium]|nr:MAG: hypothetical protein JSV79_05545 [Armatimonadota bacterium]
MSWQSALQRTLDTTYDQAQSEGLEWTVVGSVATALQGCRLSPHDIDIVTREPEVVFGFAELMRPFAAAECPAESPEEGPWHSTEEKPVFVGSYWDLDWHYAWWDVDDALVSVVHVVAPGGHPGFRDTGGVWECDPSVWPHIERLISRVGLCRSFPWRFSWRPTGPGATPSGVKVSNRGWRRSSGHSSGAGMTGHLWSGL